MLFSLDTQRRIENKKKLTKLSFASVLTVALLLPTSAFAESSVDVTSSVGISAGGLSMSSVTIPAFPDVTLDGTDQTTSSSISDFSVTDATGTGNGWHVTIEATQFTEVGGEGLTLPLNALTLDEPVSVEAVDTTSPAPSIPTAGPWIIDSGTPVKILSAAAEEGMGTYDIKFDTDNLTLTIPSNQKIVDLTHYPDGPTPYESPITFSIVSGP